jgi:hypothetical protein
MSPPRLSTDRSCAPARRFAARPPNSFKRARRCCCSALAIIAGQIEPTLVIGLMLVVFGLLQALHTWAALGLAVAVALVPFLAYPAVILAGGVLLTVLARQIAHFDGELAGVEAHPKHRQRVAEHIKQWQRQRTNGTWAASWQALLTWLSYPDPQAVGQWADRRRPRGLRRLLTLATLLLLARLLLTPVLFAIILLWPGEHPGLLALGLAWLGACAVAAALLPVAVALSAGRRLAILRARLLLPQRRSRYRYIADLVRLEAADAEQLRLSVGRHRGTNVLIAPPAQVLKSHMLLYGRPNSGKSVALARLLEQACRWYWRSRTQPNLRDRPISCVVFDLKGDSTELLGTVLNSGVPVKYVSLDERRASYSCNPFAMSRVEDIQADQRAEIVLSSLGTDLAAEYGKVYFAEQQHEPLRVAFRDTSRFANLDELMRYVIALFHDKKSPLSKAARRDGELVAQLLDDFALIAPLQATRANQPEAVYAQRVDFADLFTAPQFVHFDFSGFLSPRTGPGAARLLLNTLLQIGTTLSPAERVCDVLVIIDEAHLMANPSLMRFIAMARSVNVSFVLATQSLSTFRGRDWDLGRFLLEAVGVRMRSPRLQWHPNNLPANACKALGCLRSRIRTLGLTHRPPQSPNTGGCGIRFPQRWRARGQNRMPPRQS